MNNQEYNRGALPQFPQSMWRHTTDLPAFSKLEKDVQTDIAIIGAGITGITTAYLLSKAGFKVTVVEAAQILDGTTGFTTAKITAQHGLIYDKLRKHFGDEEAKLYYEANEEALSFIRSTVEEHQIDCQLQQEDAYLYADSEEQAEQLRKEWEAYEQLGLPGEWCESLPIPLAVHGAIRLPNQAQFHPLHYLRALVDSIIANGGVFYENTTMEDAADNTGDGRRRLKAENGCTITCKYAISASHFPFYDGGGFYFTRLHAERSYVVAIEPEIPLERGMYINCGEPKRSLRSALLEGTQVILVGGESHKTGKGKCTFKHYEELESFGGQLFGAKRIPYRWSTQDLITLDEVPYIGAITADEGNVLVATGFAKWGMTNGTVAALVFRDLIMGHGNKFTDLYKPSRFKANPGIKNFTVQNADVAKEWVSGKIELIHRKADELKTDEGGVVRHLGKRAGGYKDAEGRLFIVDTTCTHLGCEVEWNDAERSWDCPCHGSRFNYKGEVLEGPAIENLPLLSQESGNGS
ncbi:FAD-dependent oxidoreductase [Paenibacillus bouchesdurhonensis]|uniref:FAD-dependent oxidoreductase n=1 Tax=Paenibacillus bouchesdurhonensis TaxID=1870990 RepID=UPI000DA627B8|nr:FAD-dependent oxidoreductase [Paenibacillus bouchesdurhonensis]